MADDLDDIMKKDLAGLLEIAKKHGTNSDESERYLLETLKHYLNEESARKYKQIIIELLLKRDN